MAGRDDRTPPDIYLDGTRLLKAVGVGMPNIGEVTIKVNYEMTEVSKHLIRDLVAEVVKEAMLDDSARVPFDSKDAVREFIRVEVRKALAEIEEHKVGMD